MPSALHSGTCPQILCGAAGAGNGVGYLPWRSTAAGWRCGRRHWVSKASCVGLGDSTPCPANIKVPVAAFVTAAKMPPCHQHEEETFFLIAKGQLETLPSIWNSPTKQLSVGMPSKRCNFYLSPFPNGSLRKKRKHAPFAFTEKSVWSAAGIGKRD
ncbi:dolichyl-phosphate beta-glucosyltransferase-like [Onychomys torridus]|uniref:dolichyl-phosphate beta-glucosyltransferase-like n=1 Tax=Onychomys torridus TaxID=38674 RepID=UPI00167FC827|nr:dolichyl-phosphate beta-glucosyltransferase-like [Onychomys torridus]